MWKAQPYNFRIAFLSKEAFLKEDTKVKIMQVKINTVNYVRVKNSGDERQSNENENTTPKLGEICNSYYW